MTREEAKHIVDVAFSVPQAVRRDGEDRTYHEDEIREAKNMAIQALSQEPCNECRNKRTSFCGNCKEYDEFEPCGVISREDALKCFEEFHQTETLAVGYIRSRIRQLPSVTQKSGWIPCSERLPEEYGEYLVTWKTNDSSAPFISICEYETSYEYDVEKHRFKGEWLVDDYILVHSDYEVIAWMPLPKPYEPQERSEKE